MITATLNSFARRVPRCVAFSKAFAAPKGVARAPLNHATNSIRHFAMSDHDMDTFEPTAPTLLSADVLEGIMDATQFYIRHGAAAQRLKKLANDDTVTTVFKWQKIMEIYLQTQIYVVGGLGYGTDDDGIRKFSYAMSQSVAALEDDMQELLASVRRDTWRELVGAGFSIDTNDIPVLSIVDARNLMHKVSSRMLAPDILEEVEKRTSGIREQDPQLEISLRHHFVQEVIVDMVYLGGSPSIVEEAGFGTGPGAYAKMQCAMTDHEGDPLVAQYSFSAMAKLFKAAGIDLSEHAESLSNPNQPP